MKKSPGGAGMSGWLRSATIGVLAPVPMAVWRTRRWASTEELASPPFVVARCNRIRRLAMHSSAQTIALSASEIGAAPESGRENVKRDFIDSPLQARGSGKLFAVIGAVLGLEDPRHEWDADGARLRRAAAAIAARA